MTICEIYKGIQLERGSEKNPIDLIHQELPTKFMKVKSSSEEFQVVEKMLGVMGTTHTNFSLELIDVFNLSNQTQKAENWPFRKLTSRLLWYGGKHTDVAHIMR